MKMAKTNREDLDVSEAKNHGGPPYAYAFLVGGADPAVPESYLPYFYNIAIATKILREKGSKADVIVLYQNKRGIKATHLPRNHMKMLFQLGVNVYTIPETTGTTSESFYRTQMDKFRILGLTQYRKIMYLDTDVMPTGNLDKVFELSDNGTLMENIIFRGDNVPARGAHFVLTPGPGKLEALQEILDRRQAQSRSMTKPWFDEHAGWGHNFTDDDPWIAYTKRGTSWSFYAAYADQGLLLYYTKYFLKSVTIFVPGGKHENWEVPSGQSDGKLQMTQKAVNWFQGVDMNCSSFKTQPRHRWLSLPEKCLEHFFNDNKPWIKGPPEDFGKNTSFASARHHWFANLRLLNDELGLGLDFKHWQMKKPNLGFYPIQHTRD